MLRTGQGVAAHAAQLFFDTRYHIGARQDLFQRPGQRQRGGVVTGGEYRDYGITQLDVAHATPVFVLHFQQIGQQTRRAGGRGQGALGGDNLIEACIEASPQAIEGQQARVLKFLRRKQTPQDQHQRMAHLAQQAPHAGLQVFEVGAGVHA